MASTGMIDPSIFQSLQLKIDEDIAVRDQVKEILQDLEKQGRYLQASLAQAHSVHSSQYPSIVSKVETYIAEQVATIGRLSKTASQYPYYRYCNLWSREIQNTVFYILFCGWLGGSLGQGEGQQGRLLTIDQIGQILGVPVNLDTDAFHLSLEEYLHGLITLIEELGGRLVSNAVIQQDYEIPLKISTFIKGIAAGFALLNLKNDALRKRSDSIKYQVQHTTSVVYDLSIRGLLPKES